MTLFLLSLLLLVVSVMGLVGWRAADRDADERASGELLRRAGAAGSVFDPATLEDLPEPAQRFFRYTIMEGAPLFTAVEIDMMGEIGLGDKDDPRYRKMSARQILVPPHGLVWRLNAGAISGSDGATPDRSWTRFWLFGLVPVVRVSGAAHARSAFGRVVAESAFWAPASLLPSDRVHWAPIDQDTARAVVAYGPYLQNVDVTVDAQGRPQRVVIQRWSNANPEKTFREQPFGGIVSDFREVGGYRVPFHVEGGNLIGTEDYFPFFKARVQRLRFPQKR